MSLRLRLICWVARWLARKGRCWELRAPDGSVYLRRYIFFGQSPRKGDPPAVSLYLHEICADDPDKFAAHTHPWPWSYGAPLSGAYKERRLDCGPWGAWESERWVKPGMVNCLNDRDAHEVTAVMPNTWTLFFAAKEKPGDWGFLIPGHGYVQHSQAKERGLIVTSDWIRVNERGEPWSQS